MVKLLINNEPVNFTTTVFPDKTSQVWKLELENLEYDEHNDDVKILWLFENESEIMQVLQLAALTKEVLGLESHTLFVPYLPYGRQDKEIANDKSFALNVFRDVLYSADICRIETFDAHSDTNMVYSTAPEAFHESIYTNQVVCFPDKGAAERYRDSLGSRPTIFFEKVRNQLTGEITGLELINPQGLDISGENVLIVDDICDGGATFIKVAAELNKHKVHQIDLAVSHGLFSKGKQVLHDAGITNIYTTNSLLSNPEGFKVW